MNIFKRLKNLWTISNLEWLTDKQKLDIGLPIIIESKPKMAQIIRKRDPVKEALAKEI